MDGSARQISIVIRLLQEIQQKGKRRQSQKILEALVRHREDNELINLEECFIDVTFVVTKKLLMLQVYLSPCTRILLPLMKSNLCRLRSMNLSQWDVPEELSGIVPMTATRLMKPLLARELNLSRRIGRTAKRLLRKMVERFADIKDDGKSNSFLRGLTNSEK